MDPLKCSGTTALDKESFKAEKMHSKYRINTMCEGSAFHCLGNDGERQPTRHNSFQSMPKGYIHSQTHKYTTADTHSTDKQSN